MAEKTKRLPMGIENFQRIRKEDFIQKVWK